MFDARSHDCTFLWICSLKFWLYKVAALSASITEAFHKTFDFERCHYNTRITSSGRNHSAAVGVLHHTTETGFQSIKTTITV